MSLKDRFMVDLKQAMKSKDTLRKDTITMVRAAVKQIEVDQRIDVDDAGVIEIIAKQVKQKKSAIDEFEKGGRSDLVEQTQNEINILLEYLPQPLSEDELKAIVIAAVQEVGATNIKEMGKVMTVIMPQVTGRADGKILSDLVRAQLS